MEKQVIHHWILFSHFVFYQMLLANIYKSKHNSNFLLIKGDKYGKIKNRRLGLLCRG
jgi:hypothetical protein